MKKKTSIFLLVFMVFTMVVSPLFSLVSFADDMWAEDYYRAYSTTGELTEERQKDLDAQFIEFMAGYGVDFAALTITSERLDRDIEDFATGYYESCNFDYGHDRTGFQMLYIADTGEVAIVPIGSAEKYVDADLIALAEEDAPGYYDEYGEWGVMYAGFGHIRDEIVSNAQRGEDAVPALGADAGAFAIPDELTDPFADLTEIEAAASTVPSPYAGSSELPSWYPEDTSNFQFFSDPDAPRVVDNADLLTDDEEARLEDFIALVIEATGHDLVIVTDNTDYGLGQQGFADDFYDFNGYGCGNEREGALFFCDMDPYDRGGWCSCSGSDTMKLYTEDVANDIDDVVYDHLGRGQYFDAFNSWVSLMGRLFQFGYPFAPDWMPDRFSEQPVRTQDASASRVVDEKNILTDAQEAELSARIAEISNKYGVDVVLACPGYMGRSIPVRDYNSYLWQYKGFGLGNNYDALVMSIGNNGYCYTTAFGGAEKALTEVNRDRIEEKAEEALRSGNAYEAALSYLSDAEHMLKTGRVQKPLAAWLASAVAGLMGGSVFGGISAGSAQSRMKTPRTSTTAEDYLVRNSITINALYDNYLGTTTNKVYNPPAERTSSGGGGGGHSSYSGGHTSHSGSTHSGSGRKF